MTIDYLTHFETLEALLERFGDGHFEAIYFGNQETGDHHHRIKLINTPGGLQVAFHRAGRTLQGWQYSSGDYIGQPGNRGIIRKAQEVLQDYYKVHPNRMIEARMEERRTRENFGYYGLNEGEDL